MKKWVVIVVVVLAGIFFLKTTRMASYGRVMWDKARAKWERAIPRDVEIETVRNEIARLDNDIRRMLRPIAEKMVNIEQEEQAIKTADGRLNHDREQLVRLTDEVASNTERVAFRNINLTLDQAKRRLNTEVSIYEARRANLEARKKRLDAQRASVAATQEMLNRLMEQKREFSVQLEQIVADAELQKLNEIAKPLAMDNTRVSGISESLKRLRHGLSVSERERALAEQWEPKLNDNAPTTPTTTAQPVDLNRIRNVLGVQTPEGSKVAVGGTP